MSELKARTARSIANVEEMLEMGSEESIEPMLVYPKSEADKVIAELKHQRDGAFGLTNLGLTLDDLSQMARKEIDRQKYKRCLAMAKWCERKRIDAADYRIPRRKWEFYDKWHKRWLKLAEKFKPNNSTAQ